MLFAGRQRVVQSGGCLEARSAVTAGTDEGRDLLDRRHTCAAAAELRLALDEDDIALALLEPVDDRERLRVDVLSGARDEAIDEPGVIRRANRVPLRERLFECQLGRRELSRVVEQRAEERAARVRNGS